MEKNKNPAKVAQRRHTSQVFNQMWYGRSKGGKGQIRWNKQKEQERDHIHWVKVQKKLKSGEYTKDQL